MPDLRSFYDARVYNPITREYRTVRVPAEAPPKPKRARRATVTGAPRDLTGVSAGAPIDAWWRDTAFYDAGPLADMRTYVKAPAMRTHRAATVMPAEPGSITARKPSDRLDK